MTDLNNVALIGRVTHDVGERDFGYVGETAKLTLSIAVNRSRKNGEEWIDEASFFEIQYWGKPAESLKNYVSKGKQVAVKGFLKQERWEKDGEKKSKIVINAEQIQLLGGSKESTEEAPASTFKAKPTKEDLVPDNMKKYMNKPQDQEEFPEDLPF